LGKVLQSDPIGFSCDPTNLYRLVAVGSCRNWTTGAVHLKLHQQYRIMPADFQFEANDICVLRISGTLKRSEFAAAQSAMAARIDAGVKPRLLAILENFEGWERGADWNDLDFLLSHSGEIAKIAIVAEPRWEVQALAFGGAGVRRAPVKFFPLNELANGRAWLLQ
jgi:SpoIIAA-like